MAYKTQFQQLEEALSIVSEPVRKASYSVLNRIFSISHIHDPEIPEDQRLIIVHGFYHDDCHTGSEDFVYATDDAAAEKMITEIREHSTYEWEFTHTTEPVDEICFLLKQLVEKSPNQVIRDLEELMQEEDVARCSGCKKVFSKNDLSEELVCENCAITEEIL